ncbi:MAG: tRNA uridine-5-carboxymethylaminomethyl(34) synthesis GTPase MnmE [Clostridiales bacterium]|nr:tRNA uridine-5-carboxymethylaminomethyl(34) synthesis GTPase MnmE [Clostridiales bacterium]
MDRNTDTIAAIATAMSASGIGIIRISGEDAIEIADRIFRSKRNDFKLSEAPTHTIHYGVIEDQESVLDEVLVSVMRAPHSYTAEDTVEINCHGGVFVMKRILDAVIRQGARPAEPGEFTKRAFLNGRMDLSQAEAVADLISSKNEYAMKSSVSQLGGALSAKIQKLRKDLLYQIAYIESALDDPEHISLDGYAQSLRRVVCQMRTEVSDLAASFENGKILSEGIRTVILGKPNAGKSSLMNVLVGEEKSIVTDIAGTTRDVLEEQVSLHGIYLHIIDTAGIHETEDKVEKIGVFRARKAAEDADLIIYVVDGSQPLDENDEAIIRLIENRQAIVLLNKSDLEVLVTEEELAEKVNHSVLAISAKEETGIDRLEQEIMNLFYTGNIDFNDQVVITNVRHRNLLEKAMESLDLVVEGIDRQMPEDFLTIDLMDVYEYLGAILGEEVEDDLINEIFSRFCMGK